ncbi:MAG: hypothetical protein NTY38_16055 [Acidobacteria bacterium]|nr:hypothetical protein [Acidobacteriota bacterium]
MRQSAMRAGRLLLVLACPLPIANAAQFILLLHGSADSWQVQEAEKITINSKDRLRLGATGKTSLSANDYKSLQATPIARAGMLRRHAGGYLVHKEGGAWEAVVPDGVAFKGSRAYSGLWSSTEVAVFKDRNTMADFLADQANFRGVGEADANAAFEERMSLLVAVAPTVKGAAATKVQQLLLVDMESTDRKLGSGLALHSDLLAGLRIVAVSEKAFPADAQQKKARNALLTKKAWLDQRIAILKAFQAGELWDAFLDKYGEMDRFDNSFPELHKIRERAFRESAENHLAEAKRLYQIKQYLPALSELKLARRRNPSSKEITGLLETIRMEEARDYVLTRPPRPDRSTTAQYRQATRHLQFAENYMTDGKLAEADEELTAAEALDRGSPRTLLARARLLHASKEPMKAIAMLDSYDRSVRKEEEITEGETLRAKILYQVKTTRKALHDAAIAAEAAGDYTKALESAKAGLVLDPEDTEFLLTAGRSAAITRDVTLARKMLSEYLECSEMPGLDTRTRASVYDLLTLLKTTFPEPEGVPNWFSGYKAAAGVF